MSLYLFTNNNLMVVSSHLYVFAANISLRICMATNLKSSAIFCVHEFIVDGGNTIVLAFSICCILCSGRWLHELDTTVWANNVSSSLHLGKVSLLASVPAFPPVSELTYFCSNDYPSKTVFNTLFLFFQISLHPSF